MRRVLVRVVVALGGVAERGDPCVLRTRCQLDALDRTGVTTHLETLGEPFLRVVGTSVERDDVARAIRETARVFQGHEGNSNLVLHGIRHRRLVFEHDDVDDRSSTRSRSMRLVRRVNAYKVLTVRQRACWRTVQQVL